MRSLSPSRTLRPAPILPGGHLGNRLRTSAAGDELMLDRCLCLQNAVQKIDKYQTNRAGPIASSKHVQVHVNSTKAYDHTNTTNCMQCLLSWFGGSNHLLPKTIITCQSKYDYQDIIQMLSVLKKTNQKLLSLTNMDIEHVHVALNIQPGNHRYGVQRNRIRISNNKTRALHFISYHFW